MAAIQLDLHLRVAREGRAAFFEFLREAVPVYEGPGGIRIRLLESLQEPGTFIERVVYADRAAFDADQARVETDPSMRVLLARWRDLLEAPPRVETWQEIEDPAFRSPAPAP